MKTKMMMLVQEENQAIRGKSKSAKKQEDENNKEEEKNQFSKIETMMSGCNESLIAFTSKIEEATKATLLFSSNQRIDAAQSKFDKFNEALDKLDEDDSSSKNIYVFQDVRRRRI